MNTNEKQSEAMTDSEAEAKIIDGLEKRCPSLLNIVNKDFSNKQIIDISLLLAAMNDKFQEEKNKAMIICGFALLFYAIADNFLFMFGFLL